MREKELRKKINNKCLFCGEADKNVLDVHRILPGKDGGKYTLPNTVRCCANCHRKCHSGEIEIKGWYFSTKGMVLHCFKNGKEEFLQ